MTTREPNDQGLIDLDDLLTASAQDAPAPGADLMARVLEDGLALQPAPGGARQPSAGRIARVVVALGGWRGMGGLVAATCAGFWIGFMPPQSLPDMALSFLGADVVGMVNEPAELSGFGWDMDEG